METRPMTLPILLSYKAGACEAWGGADTWHVLLDCPRAGSVQYTCAPWGLMVVSNSHDLLKTSHSSLCPALTWHLNKYIITQFIVYCAMNRMAMAMSYQLLLISIPDLY